MKKFITKKRGSERIVLQIVGLESIVFKFPIIKIFKAIKTLKFYYRQNDFLHLLKKDLLRTRNYENSGLEFASKDLLFGVIQNMREFTYFLKNHKADYLAPTYFSLLGLVNIQRYAKPITANRDKFVIETKRVIGKAAYGYHIFRKPENFGRLKEKIVCVDYGNKNTGPLLDRFGERLNEMNI
jgi:hypothetical protein